MVALDTDVSLACLSVIRVVVEFALPHDLPVEPQIEVAVFVGADDVAGRFALGECSVLDVPLGREALRLVAAPAVGGPAVEEEFPTRFLLGGRERVRRAWLADLL